MSPHTLVTAVLCLLSIVGVAVWVQHVMDRAQTDAERFDGVAKQIRRGRTTRRRV